MKPFPFYGVATTLVNNGYGVDFISDRQLQKMRALMGTMYTGGAIYKTVVVPACKYIPSETMQQLLNLAKAGGTVIFLDHLPEDVPGLYQLTERRQALEQLKQRLNAVSFSGNHRKSFGQGHVIIATDVDSAMRLAYIHREPMVDQGLRYVRRKHVSGYYYFIVNQQAKDVDAWVPLAIPAGTASLFDPYTGQSGIARTRKEKGKPLEIYLQLKAGQSLIIDARDTYRQIGPAWPYFQAAGAPQTLGGKWELTFTDGQPAIARTFTLDSLHSWTLLPDTAVKVYAGAARYRISFDKPAVTADDWQLDLGTVRESAVVRLNGHTLDTLWALPFSTRIGQYLREGKNELEVEVVNLPANRIADYDRRGKEWQIFYEINFVNVFYKPFSAAGWAPVPSGLLGPVRLLPLKQI